MVGGGGTAFYVAANMVSGVYKEAQATAKRGIRRLFVFRSSVLYVCGGDVGKMLRGVAMY